MRQACVLRFAGGAVQWCRQAWVASAFEDMADHAGRRRHGRTRRGAHRRDRLREASPNRGVGDPRLPEPSPARRTRRGHALSGSGLRCLPQPRVARAQALPRSRWVGRLIHPRQRFAVYGWALEALALHSEAIYIQGVDRLRHARRPSDLRLSSPLADPVHGHRNMGRPRPRSQESPPTGVRRLGEVPTSPGDRPRALPEEPDQQQTCHGPSGNPCQRATLARITHLVKADRIWVP